MKVKIPVVFFILAMISCSGPVVESGETGQSGNKTTLSGTVTLPGNAAGRNYTVYIDTDTNSSNGTVKSLTGVCSGSTVNYTFNEADGGLFYIYCFVDADSSGGAPAAGDYKGYYTSSGTVSPYNVPSSGNAVCNFDAYVITSMKASVSGTIHLTVPITDRGYTVIAGTGWDGTGIAGSATGTVSGDTIHYEISDVDPGNYYVYCTVDADSSTGAPNTGDFLGYYGSADYNHPASADIAVPSAPDVIVLNFSVYIIPDPAKASVNGTISLPGTVTDVRFLVVIDNDNNPTTGTPLTIATADGYVTGDTIHYSITGFDPGIYYIYCLADINGNGSPSLNDYFGVCGGQDGNLVFNDYFPVAVNVTASGGAIITRDFQLFMMD